MADFLVQGENWAAFTPETIGTVSPDVGKITAVGTLFKIEALEDTNHIYANADAKQEFITKTMDNGVNVEHPKPAVTYDAATGSEKVSAGSTDSVELTVLDSGDTMFDALLALRGVVGFWCVPSGVGADLSVYKRDYIHGKLSGDISRASKGSEMQSIKIKIVGTEGVAGAGFDETDLMVPFTATINPLGGAAVTLAPTITSGNLTTLLTGTIVRLA